MIDWLARAQEKQAELVALTGRLMCIDSTEDMKTANLSQDIPYGKGPREVLDEVLAIGQSKGFAVKDFKGRVGRVEMGSKGEIVGILTHLDVVPPGEGWNTDPFVPIVKNGYLHGRGVIDDKGPTVAALLAMELVRQEVSDMNRRVHLIMGCNEETGMDCMHYYVENVPDLPALGVTPDNSFPVIFGEKGILQTAFSGFYSGPVISLRAGIRPNVVPNLAEASVSIGARDPAALEHAFARFLQENRLTGKIEMGDSVCNLTINGVSCHSQQPEDGVNAASAMLRCIGTLFDDPTCRTLGALFSPCDGSGLGIAATGRHMKSLTCSLGLLSIENWKVSATVDIRYPNECNDTMLMEKIRMRLKDEDIGLTAHQNSNTPPLFIPPDDPFIQLLLSAYQEITGDMQTPPGVTGGGTYARLFERHVAFGPIFPQRTPPCEGVGTLHQPNEAMRVDELVMLCAIYAKLIYELVK